MNAFIKIKDYFNLMFRHIPKNKNTNCFEKTNKQNMQSLSLLCV